MQLVLLLILVWLMHAARSFAPSPGLGVSAPALTLAAGFLLLSALIVGNLIRKLQVPQLTGYLLTGIVVGPQLLDLITDPMLDRLRIFNGVATALIALTAGVEMDFRSLRPLLRGIAWISGVAVMGTVVVLTATVFLLRGMLPFAAGWDAWQLLAIASVIGVTLASQSPAVVVALRKELDADGPVTRTVLGVVVVSDLLIIVLFALTSSLARTMISPAGEQALAGPALSWEIFGSAAIGILVGVVVASFLRNFSAGGALFVTAVGFLVAEVGQRIDLDPLIIALAAGMLIRNLTRQADRLHREIEAASLPVYVAFFAVAGAAIHLDALALVGAPALILLFTRAGGLLGGTALASRFAGSEPNVGRFAGFGLLPQAGLALALASLFERSFPQFGADASALVFSIVALNEVFAPVLYRWALSRTQEVGRATKPGAIPPNSDSVRESAPGAAGTATDPG